LNESEISVDLENVCSIRGPKAGCGKNLKTRVSLFPLHRKPPAWAFGPCIHAEAATDHAPKGASAGAVLLAPWRASYERRWFGAPFFAPSGDRFRSMGRTMSATQFRHSAICALILAPLIHFSTPDPAVAQSRSASKGLTLPTTFDPKARTIVFVHGLGSSCDATFGDFMKFCRAAGIQALPFEYPNYGPIAESGKALAAALTELETAHPDAKIVIVAHSMGGLVARYALEVARPAPAKVADLITVATPHHGSLMAEHGHLLRVVENLIKLTGPAAFLAEGRGEACRDLNPGSAVLQKLASAKPAQGVKYHVIIGSRAAFRVDEWALTLKDVRRIGENRLRWKPEEAERIIGNLSQMDEVVHGKGDGAVALGRAKLAGAATERVFELGHLELTRGRDGEIVWSHILKTLNWQK